MYFIQVIFGFTISSPKYTVILLLIFIQPDEAAYDEIPIEQFGVAMLRGMGWKEGQGIGRNKEYVAQQ